MLVGECENRVSDHVPPGATSKSAVALPQALIARAGGAHGHRKPALRRLRLRALSVRREGARRPDFRVWRRVCLLDLAPPGRRRPTRARSRKRVLLGSSSIICLASSSVVRTLSASCSVSW